jgi:hypothetical protein
VGFSPVPKTIGIVVVAALAATAGVVIGVAITATCRRTRSAISADRLSYWPSSQWYSTVTAFDVAGFVEAFAERGHAASGGIERSTVDKFDYRHRLLLRACH